jgi:hypothetical protein
VSTLAELIPYISVLLPNLVSLESYVCKQGLFFLTYYYLRSRCSDGLQTGRPGFDSRHGKIFLVSTASRPVLGPIHPPAQWVSGTTSPGVKRPGREADHSPPFSAEVKNGGAIPPLPHMSSWHIA